MDGILPVHADLVLETEMAFISAHSGFQVLSDDPQILVEVDGDHVAHIVMAGGPPDEWRQIF
jgi:hypothetical protein